MVDFNYDRRTATVPFFGHHGISLGRGRDNLLSGFSVLAPQVRAGREHTAEILLDL